LGYRLLNIVKILRLDVEKTKGVDAMNGKVTRQNSIKTKLVLVFLLPVVLMIILGIISFNQSSTSMTETYEKNALMTLNMMGTYLDLGFQTVEGKGIQLNTNEIIKKYYSADDTEKNHSSVEQYKNVQNMVSSVVLNDNIISNIYILTDSKAGVSAHSSLSPGLYTEYMNSEEGKMFVESNQKYMWTGYHPHLDEVLKIDSADYGATLNYYLYNNNNKKVGLIVLDINSSFIDEVLEKVDFGQQSIVGLVTQDGREILKGSNTEDFSIKETEFGKQLINGTLSEESGVSYVTYNNQKYLFVHQPVSKGAMYLWTLIPEQMIISQSSKMLKITVSFVIMASLIGMIVVGFMVRDISKAIYQMNNVTSSAAEGNLRQEIKLKRKDEFYLLGKGISYMISSMRKLIGGMKEESQEVAEAAAKVDASTTKLHSATMKITEVVNNISGITQNQADDAKSCLIKMSELSEQIKVVSGKAENITEVTQRVQGDIEYGMTSMNVLSENANHTAIISKEIIEHIQVLEEKTNLIHEIVSTINQIAKQTTLLSLNASIEAARAGQAGTGFMIVASEIGELAKESQTAASKIQEILNGISQQTKDTVISAKKSEEIVAIEHRSLDEAHKVFGSIKIEINLLSKYLEELMLSVGQMHSAKEDTLGAVQNITEIAEHTVENTEILNITNERQREVVEELYLAVEKLRITSDCLEESVSVFKTV